jgi:hypothetical protein
MCNTNDNGIWVAVRVQRGFVSDVQAFGDERPARQRAASWRRQMNPDYDEIAVLHVHVSACTRPGTHKDLNKRT